MHGCNGHDVIIDGRQVEGDPCSPAIPSHQPLGEPFALQMAAEFLVFGVDVGQLLLFDHFQQLRDIFYWA